MTATIGMQLRLPEDVAAALERVAPRGRKTAYILALLRRDLERRGELKRVTARTSTGTRG